MKIIPIILVSTFVLLSGCSGCSKSGQKQRLSHQSDRTTREERPISGEKTIVKMEKVNGVFQIPVEVNGVKMYFIFDTGASIISISETEANFLWRERNERKGDSQTGADRTCGSVRRDFVAAGADGPVPEARAARRTGCGLAGSRNRRLA